LFFIVDGSATVDHFYCISH